MALALPLSAHAEAADFNIAPQPLTSALKEFGVQSQYTIVAQPDVVAAKTSRGVTQSAEPPSRITEGDLFVVDADPRDGDESMELCIDASVSGPSPGAVRVARVKGNCRRFVVVAQASGDAEVRFEARGTASVLVLNIAPAR